MEIAIIDYISHVSTQSFYVNFKTQRVNSIHINTSNVAKLCLKTLAAFEIAYFPTV